MKDSNDTQTLELLPEASTQRGRGRPRKADALTPAERAQRYRDRKKALGLKPVSTWVRDVDAPLTSDILDLSEVRRW